MSKLKSVIRHEYVTIIKQPSFWISMLAIPILIGAALGLSYLGNKSSEERIDQLAKDLKNVAIIDKSGLLKEEVVAGSGLSLSQPSEFTALREQVRTEKIEALIVYPEDLSKSRNYDIYLSSNDLTKSSSVSSLGGNLIKTSLFLPLGSSDIIALAQSGAESTITTYEDGEQTAGFNAYIVPGIFVVLFYIIFAFSVSYMLSSISEEKENRSMEMVLTYVRGRSLIIGKLLAVVLVTLTQIVFFASLAAIAYIALKQLKWEMGAILPAGIDLSQLVFDPVSVFFGASFLLVGFLMFAGFMTSTAAIAPSAKEANSFSAVFFVGAFIPFYFIMMIVTDPGNPVVRFLTYFPFTSPVVTLLRNTVGNMSLVESWLALVTMTVFMILSLAIAIRAFNLGALEFSSRLKLSSLFKKS